VGAAPHRGIDFSCLAHAVQSMMDPPRNATLLRLALRFCRRQRLCGADLEPYDKVVHGHGQY
jgi:hypothetical protein